MARVCPFTSMAYCAVRSDFGAVAPQDCKLDSQQHMTSFNSPCSEIVHLDSVEISEEPWSWEFATVRRVEINEHFASFQRKRSAVWNGRVLLLKRYSIRDATFLGSCFETDYASFIAWRHWNCPDPTVYNFFTVAALRSADGAYLVGEMAPYTAGAGRLYFPGGTPDPSDVDARGSVRSDRTFNPRTPRRNWHRHR